MKLSTELHITSENKIRYLSETTVDVKKSFICNYLKKALVTDKDKIKYIYIDDFAIRKRHTYGFIMI